MEKEQQQVEFASSKAIEGMVEQDVTREDLWTWVVSGTGGII